VPLQGFNAWVKRALDILLSAAALAVLAVPIAVIAALVRWTSSGAVFYRQERMGLDGRAFTVFKIRSMYQNAEDTSGPGVGARRRPAHDAGGPLAAAASTSTSCRSSGTCSRATCRSWGRGPSARSSSSSSSTASRSTCCAQGEGRYHRLGAGERWRGNTSLEKRIEFDLYYIENWSVTLDIKIMWLTLVRGLFQRSPAV
jgi:lipopolysaccharide/colanic/teichoic acid biosynthesis glycosyltransferase